jgi:hypothetical protein
MHPSAPRHTIVRPWLQHRLVTLATAAAMLAALQTGCGGYASHPIVAEAERELAVNDTVASELGSGVKRSSGVTGSSSETDGRASLRFEAAGDKNSGTVVVEGRLFDNAWGITSLELRLAGDQRIVLTKDLEERTGVDTPAFDPTATTTPATTAEPPPDVEIALPPGIPGGPPGE